MFIKADKEGAEVIKQLCDVALRAGGLSNLGVISNVLNSLDHPGKPKPEPEPEIKPDKKKKE